MQHNRDLLLLMVVGTISLSIFSVADSKYVYGVAWPYKAELSGQNVVSPVATSASGLAKFRMIDNDTAIRYRVNMTDISNVTGGHIHTGKVGQNGEVVVDLFQIGFSKHKETSYGMILRGNITDAILEGPMKVKTIADLVALMETGVAYVDIHTKKYTEGEIRGQIETSNPSNMSGVGLPLKIEQSSISVKN